MYRLLKSSRCSVLQVVLELTPSPWPIAAESKSNLNYRQPIYPKTIVQAWDLGFLACRLKNDSKLLSVGIEIEGKHMVIKPKELLDMRATLVDMESRKSILQHVRGFFTFVNFIWLLSIVGIVTTASPVLMLIAHPIHQLIRYLAIEIILPFLQAIKPVYEATAWILCYGFIVHAYRYSDSDSQVFICLTGIFGSMFAMAYTTHLHPPKMYPANFQVRRALHTKKVIFHCTQKGSP